MLQQVLFERAMYNRDIVEIEWKKQGLSGLFRIKAVYDDYIIIQAGVHTEEVRYEPDGQTLSNPRVAYNRHEAIRFEVHQVCNDVVVGIGDKAGDRLNIGI